MLASPLVSPLIHLNPADNVAVARARVAPSAPGTTLRAAAVSGWA